MKALTPREIRIVDCLQKRCSNAAHQPLDQFRRITAHTAGIRFVWAVGLLSLYAFFSLLAQIA